MSGSKGLEASTTETTLSSDAVDNAYRTALMATIDLDGTPKLDGFRRPDGSNPVSTEKDPNGMHKLRIEMPNGDVEYWRQVGSTRTPTEFRALAYERYNNDETQSLYIESGENSGPQTMIVLPGSQKIPADRETAMTVVKGEDMGWRFNEAEAFASQIAQYIEDRAILSQNSEAYGENGHGYGHIIIGSHSMGVYGLAPSLQTIRDELSLNPDAVVLAPLGGGQALQMYAEQLAGEGATPEAITNTANSLSDNVVSFRPGVWTIFSELQVGPGEGGNDMFGEQMSFEAVLYDVPILGGPDDNFLEYICPNQTELFSNTNVLTHETSAFVNGALANGAGFVEPRQVFDNEHTSRGWDHERSIANTAEFNDKVGGLVDVKNVFNAAAKAIDTNQTVVMDLENTGMAWNPQPGFETPDQGVKPTEIAQTANTGFSFGKMFGGG